jgi:hypothetical protein
MAHAVILRRTRLAHGLMLMAALAPWPARAIGPAHPFAAPSLARAGSGHDDDTPAPRASRLGGLRLGAAPAALIDGQWVALGARSSSGARLQEIQPPYAVLRHPDGRSERLVLDSRQPGTPTPAQVDKTLLP